MTQQLKMKIKQIIHSDDKGLKIQRVFKIFYLIEGVFFKSNKKIKSIFTLNRLIRFFNLIAFAQGNIAFRVSLKRHLINQNLYNTNPSTVLDFHEIFREINHSESLWNLGYYKKSCEIRKKCIEKIYSFRKIEDPLYAPSFLSYEWCGAFGHLGLLGAFLLAQDKDLIPPKKRTLHVYTDEQVRQINLLVQGRVNVIKSPWKSSMFQHPSRWHLSERLMMIKSSEGFIPLYELLEKTYSSRILMHNEPYLHLDFDYEVNAREKLLQLGLPEGTWFVGFHIREKLDKFDPRYASLNSFLPALKEIVRSGGWVIRFGTGKMEPIVGVKNVLDLNLDSPENRFLHFYILANSRFILSTNSGPTVLGWAFGTPVLQTNTISIARNITTASKGTIWLPKAYFYKGSRCSYARLVDSLEGYSETNLKEKEKLGFRLLENTEEEILEATQDMLRCPANANQTKSNIELKKIRENFNVVGYGTIAPSFLNKHESWFLS